MCSSERQINAVLICQIWRRCWKN